MKTRSAITLADVQAAYSGPELQLWELIMGEQVHVGGMQSSNDLAARADIRAGSRGVDLCCCTGAGMRFLVRQRGVAHMTGVDATAHTIRIGHERCVREKLGDAILFVVADACESGLPDESADFVWGEDAWCYVADKRKLVAEAARIVVPKGTIAFTDWVEGPTPMTGDEAQRFLAFMKFPSCARIKDYASMLRAAGCTIVTAEDTGRFAPCIDLYLDLLSRQFTYDALKILGFDHAQFATIATEMHFMRRLVHAGKLAQGLFVARKG